MPMYDFRCRNCNAEFEELVPRDYGEVPCPHCQSTDTQRLMSAFSSRSGGSSRAFSAPSGGGGGCAPSG